MSIHVEQMRYPCRIESPLLCDTVEPDPSSSLPEDFYSKQTLEDLLKNENILGGMSTQQQQLQESSPLHCSESTWRIQITHQPPVDNRCQDST